MCPNCGTVTFKAKENLPPTTSYGSYSETYQNQSPGYAENIQQDYVTPHSQEYHSLQQNYSYGQNFNAPPMYQQAPFNVTVFHTNNSTPLIVELLLSIFLGIFGVGWLIAGETTVGVILLICSFLLYWPILLIGIIFTLGLGIICLGPLAIGAIILNAILLNNRLKRKATLYMPIPPR